MTVYLLHLDPPFKQATHYTGYTPDPSAGRRVAEHLAGHGSPLVRAALGAGSTVHTAREWAGAGRDFERWLKSLRTPRRWCPLCNVQPQAIAPEDIPQAFRDRKPSYRGGAA